MDDSNKKHAALFHDYPALHGDVFGRGRRERIGSITQLYPHVVNNANFLEHANNLAQVEVIFASWGMPALAPEQFAAMPRLRAVFYAAGNVKAFAAPLLERDVLLVSAWAVNAIPTAQMVLAQILLVCRGYFRAVRSYRAVRQLAPAKEFERRGAAGETVGIIGMGYIGSTLARDLLKLGFRVLASDPYLVPERAAELGVELVTPEELFERAYIVSNHIPDLPSTQQVLNGALFTRMRDGATFINSGRGAQVVERELIAVLDRREDLTALLDVTSPEPPAPDSALWILPNVVLSPHIGGTIGDEVTRLADCVIEEFEAWRQDKPLRYQVTRKVFETMG